jgi:hypothetical protein
LLRTPVTSGPFELLEDPVLAADSTQDDDGERGWRWIN